MVEFAGFLLGLARTVVFFGFAAILPHDWKKWINHRTLIARRKQAENTASTLL
jgi:hypothetical protein